MTAPEAPKIDLYKSLVADRLGKQEVEIIDLKAQILLWQQRHHQAQGQLQVAHARIKELEHPGDANPETATADAAKA